MKSSLVSHSLIIILILLLSTVSQAKKSQKEDSLISPVVEILQGESKSVHGFMITINNIIEKRLLDFGWELRIDIEIKKGDIKNNLAFSLLETGGSAQEWEGFKFKVIKVEGFQFGKCRVFLEISPNE